MKPVVAHIRAANFYGGPERQIVSHVKTSTGFQHLIVTFQDGEQENEFASICHAQNIPVALVKAQNAYQWSSVNQLRQILLDHCVAIICSHGYRPLALSLLAKKRLHVPLLAFARGHTSENVKVRLYSLLERICFRYAHKVIAVSQGYADKLRSLGIAPDKIVVVQNAIDTKRFSSSLAQITQVRTELGYSGSEFLIATAGRISPEKNQVALLKAFALVRNQHADCRLMIIGDGPQKGELVEYVQRNNIPDVQFLGHRKDLDRIMTALDLFVLPSLTEGLPNVLLEAACCHVPIVATAVGGVPEIVQHEVTGLLVQPDDVQGLASAIMQYRLSPDLRLSTQSAAYRLVETHFDLAAQSQKLESLYREILRR